MLKLAWSFIRRDFWLAISYRSAFAMQLAGIFFLVPVIYYSSRIVGGSAAPSLGPYGTDYFPFLLLGIAFQDFMTISLSTFNASIRDHQLMGTLEIVMLSPTPVPMVLLYSSLYSYVFTSLRFALYLAVGMAFGLDLIHANVVSFVIVMVLSIASFAPLGILSAALTLTIKRGETANMILSGASVVLSGVIYPVGILPVPLQKCAQFLPFTHSLSGIRKAFLMGVGPDQLLPEIGRLALFAIILLPLALLIFQAATRHAKVTGTLGQY